MPVPQTLARDPATGYLSLAGGTLNLTSTMRDYALVAVGEKLRMFAGEWYLDTREGVPYFKIVSTRPDMPLLRSLFRRAVQAVPCVANVTSIDLTFDGPTRTLSVAVSCTLTDGSVLTDVPYLVPWIVTDINGAGNS